MRCERMRWPLSRETRSSGCKGIAHCATRWSHNSAIPSRWRKWDRFWRDVQRRARGQKAPRLIPCCFDAHPAGGFMTATISLPPASTAPPRAQHKIAPVALLLVAIFSAFVFFYHLGRAQLTDWDEAWHAQVSSEILSTGDLLTFHYRGQPYFNKPPLTFWLRALAFRVGGVNETTARFFPALFSWATVVIVVFFFGRLFEPAVGILAGLILCTSWLFCFHH